MVGEAKISASAREAGNPLAERERKAARCPELAGKHVTAALRLLRRRGRIADELVVDVEAVVDSAW